MSNMEKNVPCDTSLFQFALSENMCSVTFGDEICSVCHDSTENTNTTCNVCAGSFHIECFTKHKHEIRQSYETITSDPDEVDEMVEMINSEHISENDWRKEIESLEKLVKRSESKGRVFTCEKAYLQAIQQKQIDFIHVGKWVGFVDGGWWKDSKGNSFFDYKTMITKDEGWKDCISKSQAGFVIQIGHEFPQASVFIAQKG